MRRLVILTLCAAALGPVGAQSRYDGFVVDHLGEPVPAARITLLAGPSAVSLGATLTDGEGEFHFASAPIGQVSPWARVEAAGRATTTASIDTRQPSRIVMRPLARGPLVGEVVTPGGAPIEGALVAAQARGQRRGRWGEATTGAQGRFAIRDLDSGVHTLVVCADGRAPVQVDGLRAGNAVPVRVTMAAAPTATLELVVEGASPSTVGYAVWERGEPTRPLVAPVLPAFPPLGADGRVVLRGLPTCSAQVNVDALDAWFDSPQGVALVAGETVRLRIGPRTASEARIRFAVVDRAGGPVAGARLLIRDTRRGRVVATDGAGRGSFRSRLWPGQPIGAQPVDVDILPWDARNDGPLGMWELPPDGAEVATLVAARSVEVSGFVRTSSGRPIARRLVTTGEGRDRRFAWSDARGRFALAVPSTTDATIELAVRASDGSVEGEARVHVPRRTDSPEPTLVAEAPGRIVGRVTAAGGGPTDGVEVALFPVGIDGRSTLRPDVVVLSGPDGRFGFADVAPGSYRLTAGERTCDCEVRPESVSRLELGR